MTPLRLLWRVLTGADASMLDEHDQRIRKLEHRAADIERKLEIKQALRSLVGEEK